MSFDRLKKIEELREAADGFAVELSEAERKSKKLIVAALVESGVTFEDYLNMFPHKREEYAPETIVKEEPENVVTSADATGSTEPVVVEAVVEDEPVEIVTKEETALTNNQKWLVKMERSNPLFEVAGHKFTQEHPYALMDAAAAEIALREEGFRQAYPSEAEAFYRG